MDIDPRPDPRIGLVLVETYRLERLIGAGGMGSVYEARHLRLPKRFAVKFLNAELIDNAEALARFRREAEVVATLSHPSVVDLIDYNVGADGLPYIVLEYLDGKHLGWRLAAGRMPLGEALRILAPVGNALAAAHARGIVHRDLKPENIVLCDDERVKVVDFGIAKIVDGRELTAHNVILGTVPYMAPERLFGEHVDASADQFALAAIAYEMLAGTMAFDSSGSVPEVAARVLHHQPPPIEGVPEPVYAALSRAMAKQPQDRYPSMLAFVEALIAAASSPEPSRTTVEPSAPASTPSTPSSPNEPPPLAEEPTRIAARAHSAPAERVTRELVPEPTRIVARRALAAPTGTGPTSAGAVPAARETVEVDRPGVANSTTTWLALGLTLLGLVTAGLWLYFR